MAKAKKRSSKKPVRAKKTARRAPAKIAKKKAAPKQAAASGIEALAKEIVRLTQLPGFGKAELAQLYNPDCTSVEASGQTAVGYAGLEEKLKGWEQMQSGTSWKPRNVWTGRNTVCIEWDATVNLRDGRTVQLREIGIHEIKNGKIQRERFYYNPNDLAPPPQSLPGV
jgi:ketosteroid isomerase-like protein